MVNSTQKKLFSILIFSVSTLFIFSCKKSDPFAPATGGGGGGTNNPPVTDTVPTLAAVRNGLVDKTSTDETAALWYNLKKISKTNILFGHQDATKRGLTNASTQWANEQHLPSIARDKSDVKEVTGSFPAVYGHDFLHIANFTDGAWFDYEAQIARDLTIDAYNRGGINTYAWHYNNPVSKGSFYWNDSPVEAVSQILPGAAYNNVYKASLKEVADFAKSLIGADGKLVPVIFRPFHEFDGDWFWWGKAHTTAANYKALFQYTVTYLRDSLGVHNFIYAWSPDRNYNSETEFLERYPGDDFVDLVGADNYWDMRAGTSPTVAAGKMKIVSDYAKKKNKVAAMTETGLQNLTQSDWYTQMLQKVLQNQKLEMAYVLVWANTKDAYWTPYKGHTAEADFIKFKNEPYIMFGSEMPDMYKLK